MSEHIDYRAVLADLKLRQADLTAAIAGIEHMVGISRARSTSNGEEYSSSQTPAVPQLIIKFLEESPSHVFSIEDVAGNVPVEMKTVRSTLARLAGEGRIRRSSRGLYQAKQAQGSVLEEK